MGRSGPQEGKNPQPYLQVNRRVCLCMRGQLGGGDGQVEGMAVSWVQVHVG